MSGTNRSWTSIAVGVAVLAAVAAAGYTLRAGGGEQDAPAPDTESAKPNLQTQNVTAPESVSHPLLGKAMPGVTLPQLGGGTVNLADYRGKRVILNFWTSW